MDFEFFKKTTNSFKNFRKRTTKMIILDNGIPPQMNYERIVCFSQGWFVLNLAGILSEWVQRGCVIKILNYQTKEEHYLLDEIKKQLGSVEVHALEHLDTPISDFIGLKPLLKEEIGLQKNLFFVIGQHDFFLEIKRIL